MISIKGKTIDRIVIVAGLSTLICAILSRYFDNYLLNFARTVSGIIFILTSGWPYMNLLDKNGKIRTSIRALFTVAISLFLIYPAGLINVIIEGKTDIYGEHLAGFIAVLFAISIVGFLVQKILKIKLSDIKIEEDKKYLLILAGIFLTGLVLRIVNLGAANLNGDEVDMGAGIYDLVDGMVAGRNAYFISQVAHSPLGFYIGHAFYNLFEPRGFYEMADWMIRAPQVIMGMLVIFGTYVLAKMLIKPENKWAILIPPSIIAISSYSNFASRLAIFQDLNSLDFFLIATLLAILLFRKEKSNLNALMIGIMFGILLMVKFTGVVLLPLLLIFYKDWKKILPALLVILVIFSPVIAYNIGAYFTTGYMDVPFSKIANLIGIDAKSLMNPGTGVDTMYSGEFRNPLLTLVELPFSLIDEWGYAFALLFAWSLFASLKNKECRILIAVILLEILFYDLNGFRTYYLSFLSVLCAVLVGTNFVKNKKTKIGILSAAAIFTLIFNINTNILLKEADVLKEHGRSGDDDVFQIEWHNQFEDTFSYGAYSFLNDRGWDELQVFLDANTDENTKLILDEDLNYPDIKWYLCIDDIIREYYGDPNYKEAYTYEYFATPPSELEPTEILISKTKYDISDARENLVYDMHGNIEFYVYLPD
ncbi:MAG: hypothetical protein UV80_C0005G0006 [Candidatus Peregrinibacteria bacterium GW2011_GWF2_43_17]|nr:MAG: hypothetical protein UV80_C0005G0006 [Candidatus Peregrinibacteria bacterium GW2011_GWF2_43_17]KKT19630.1 MAG: hypothetical protein UW03_C0015G0006 [Candidatus Peregrinibacteria bacterium GW2011_GWA2_43_8]HAU40077.1 hypothetical protein [Candidatus Peregrinibacteria bacterium]